MAEMRMSNVIIVVVLVAIVGVVGAAFLGYISLGPLNKKDLTGLVDKGLQTASGFTPAKTPQEAMDKFREAIEARKYKTAATYVTKEYADVLERSHTGAAELGASIDQIREYARNKGLETDKLSFLLHKLDPFPKNLKSGSVPAKKGDKTYGSFTLEGTTFTTPLDKLADSLRDMDQRMFLNTLGPRDVFSLPIEIVQEGEVWKLNVPMNPVWLAVVGHFNDNWKTYHTGLDSFRGSMLNERFSTPAAFEQEVVEKLRGAKK